MKQITINSIRNLVAGLLVGYGFVSFMCFFILQEFWARSAPQEPNTSLGLTFVHDEHGSYTYLSAFQATALQLMFMTSIPLAFLGVLLAPKKNVNSKVRWYAARFKWDQDDPKKLMKLATIIGAVVTPFFVLFVGPYIVRRLNAAGFIVNGG